MINDFKTQHKKKFILLYLNINSVFNKVHELDQILEKCNPDAFLIDESKLDCLIAISWYIIVQIILNVSKIFLKHLF